jgi:hypothetical protein
LLRSYGVRGVTGDRYAGEWPRERFRVHGIEYQVAEKTKSDIYRDVLPILNSGRAELLALPLIPVDAIKAANAKPEEPKTPEHPCPCCGSRMRIIETFLRGQQPKHRATPLAPKIGIDTS